MVTEYSISTTTPDFNFNPHHYESGDELRAVLFEIENNFNPHHYESGDL